MSYVTPEQVRDAVNDYGSINKAANHLGIARETAQRRMKKLRHQNDDGVEYPDLPRDELPMNELLDRKVQDIKRAKRVHEARELIRVKVRSNLPLGFTIFGDPHTDDDYCDIEQLLHDADVTRETPGLGGINVGDNNNLWPGRLARLYAHQRTRADEGWRLTEHFIERTRDWRALMKGNHDHFVGDGDPLDWIHGAFDAPVGDYNIRMAFEFPNGREFRFWLRHDFSGHSQWHNLHGMVKTAKFGAPFHLLMGGHKHCAGHHAELHPQTGIFYNALRVSGYKLFDSHADSLQLEPDSSMPSAVCVVDPRAEKERDFAKVMYSTEEGADYLTFKRKKAGA